MPLIWTNASTPVPARHSPFDRLLARLRGEPPMNIYLIEFERATKDSPVVYRTYWNGEHHLDFTDVAKLSSCVSDMAVDVPHRFVVRCTFMESSAEAKYIQSMLECELWRVELSRRGKGNLFIR